jgi:hypothetical protein
MCGKQNVCNANGKSRNWRYFIYKFVQRFFAGKLSNSKTGYKSFAEIASLWVAVSELFEKVSQTKDFKYIEQASGILKTISEKEKTAMELLATV